MLEKLRSSSKASRSNSSKPNVSRKRALWAIQAAATMLAAGGLQAGNVTWDGGPSTTGTDIGTAENWIGDILPSAGTPDVAIFDGTVPGALSLVYSNTVFGGSAGNQGLTLSLTGTQTSNLSIDSGANTASMRLGGGGNAVTIASGAGAFTLGDSAGVFNITLGGAGTTTQAFTNNSSSLATISSDVVFGTGGGGNHTFSFGGSGNWQLSNNFTNSSGNVQIFKTGTGVATLSGANSYTGATTVTAGTLNIAGNNAQSSIQITNAASQSAVVNVLSGNLAINTNIMIGNAAASTSNYALMNMSGGSINQTGANRFRIGWSQGNGSVGMFRMSGGSISTTLGIALNDTAGATAGLGGFSNMYVTGGSITSNANPGMGIGGRLGTSDVTIAGTGQVLLTNSTGLGASIAGTSAAGDAGRVAVLNLGNGGAGGLLQTAAVTQSATQSPLGYVNFNGGTLKAQTTTTNFMSGITQVTVHAAGGTIDNNGVSITIPQAFSDPTGNGLTSIGVSGASGYTGIPYVQISGGGATVPATAVANVDGSGNVTGITITNPGSGYTSAPTVTLVGGGGSGGTITPTIGAISAGALNFTGGGTTVLSGNTTRSGANNVTGGVLLGATGASSTSPVNVAAGTGFGAVRTAATGSFTQSSAVTLAAGASLKFDLGSFGNPTGAVMDITPAGGLIRNGTHTIDITGSNLSIGQFTLIDYAGSLGGSGNFTLGTLPARILGNLIDTGSTIDLDITSFDTIKWAGPGSDWDVNTSENWKFTSTSNPAKYLQGDVVTFDDAASNFTVNLTAVNLQPTSITVDNSANDYTFSGAGSISGATGLTKSGTSRLTIANDGANAFTGTVTINDGTLQVGNGGTGGSLGSGTQTVNNATLHYFKSAASTISRNISGTGTLIIENGANITGNNTYDGPTYILSGTVTPSSAAAFGNNLGGTTLSNNSQIYATTADMNFGTEAFVLDNAQWHTGGNRTITIGGLVTLLGSSTFNADGGSTGNITGDLSATGVDVNKAGNGVFILAGSSTFNNANVAGGRLIIAGNATYANSNVTGVLQIGNGGVLGNLGSGIVDNLGGVEFNRSDTYSVPASTIFNTGTVTNTGTGTTILSGDNSFLTGLLRATNGVLRLDAGNLGSGQILTEGAGFVQVRDANAVANVGSVNIIGNNTQTGGLQVGNSVTDLLSGKPINLNARGNLTPGITSMDGNNSIAANVVLQAGGQDYTIQVNAGSSLEMKGELTAAVTGSLRNVRLQGDGVGTFSGAITTGNAGTMTVNKLGTGTWTLNAANSYNGDTTSTAGTLVLVGAAKNPVIDSGRFGITNGGALSLDYNDTGDTGTWGSEILSDLATNEATGFLAGKVRTTQALNATRAIGWKDDTTAKVFTTRYTHKGDINLDGLVDSTDFNAFVDGYGKTSGGIWADGNFDYNDGGKVNTLDFNYLAGNFGAAPIGGALPDAAPTAALGAVVPEPATLGVLGLGLLSLLGRRRRDVR